MTNSKKKHDKRYDGRSTGGYGRDQTFKNFILHSHENRFNHCEYEFLGVRIYLEKRNLRGNLISKIFEEKKSKVQYITTIF